MRKRYFITGGAGFIGAHLTNRLLSLGHSVTVYDDFTNGFLWHFGANVTNPYLQVVRADIRDAETLEKAIAGHDVVFHFASNADIARSSVEPDIDFTIGTLLTRCVLEAMRKTGVKRIAFTSGSGVYGDVPATPIPEDYDKMIPVSTYGAQKLASEALISAYSFMFEMHGMVFRFANVVGPQQTHGVAYDFLRRLAKDPGSLKILGDGTQDKPYIHISDVLDAFLLIETESLGGYEYHNVASQDSLTVREIADIVCNSMDLKNVPYHFTGGNRGWKADVPFYRLDTSKIRRRGWANKMNSREAVTDSVRSMVEDIRAGRIPPAE
ncbi:MAG: NAD-dependent epimerase/dehydratase family protein [Verrucomicrobia bacterium]|nr:NAD-dependent epimerase/dehydratase family protein [Verrucomicrobiota bacterium]